MKNNLLKTVLCVTLLLSAGNNVPAMGKQTNDNINANSNDLFGNNDLQDSINNLDNKDVQNRIIKIVYNKAKKCFNELDKIKHDVINLNSGNNNLKYYTEFVNSFIENNQNNIYDLYYSVISGIKQYNDNLKLYYNAISQSKELKKMLNILEYLQSKIFKQYKSKNIQFGIIILNYQNSELHKQIDKINSTYEAKKNELRELSIKYWFDVMRNENLISDTQRAIKEMMLQKHNPTDFGTAENKEMLQKHNPTDLETTENQELTPQKIFVLNSLKNKLQTYENDLKTANKKIDDLNKSFENIDKQNKEQITPYQKQLEKNQEAIKNLMNKYYNRSVIASNLCNTINYCYYTQNKYHELIEQYKEEINKCEQAMINGRQKWAQLYLKYCGNTTLEA